MVAHSCRVLLLLLLTLSHDVVVRTVAGTHDLRDLPCPNAQDILPCACSVEREMRMNMDCSYVTNGDELARAFSAFFPFRHFHSLFIQDNAFLKVLRAGDLGSATFREFHVTGGVLEAVEEKALSGSVSTAVHMNFSDNRLSEFLFEHLYSYRELQTLDLVGNNLQRFPYFYSDKLRYLYLSFNPLGYVPYIAFKNLPLLTAVVLANMDVQNVEPGTFAGLEHLSFVSLADNQLTSLQEGALEVSDSVFQVDLISNSISNVSVDAFSGLTDGFIYLENNSLKELQEEVWRPVLEANNYLYLMGNPLTCGCDIAWIILNDTFITYITPDTTCADGETLIDLDPAMYQDLC